jgi:hypothetical protein
MFHQVFTAVYGNAKPETKDRLKRIAFLLAIATLIIFLYLIFNLPALKNYQNYVTRDPSYFNNDNLPISIINFSNIMFALSGTLVGAPFLWQAKKVMNNRIDDLESKSK